MLLLSLLLCTAAAAAAAAAVAAMAATDSNLTSNRLSWSTASEDSDLVPPDVSDSDGGFSSLDSMLQWAIGTK